MQAITTKYIGPSTVKGSRYKAVSGSGLSVTIPADHSKDSDQNHLAAAVALAKKLGWAGRLIGGGTQDGYAFVFAASHLTATVKGTPETTIRA